MRNAVFTLTPFHWPVEPHPTLTGCLAIASHTLRIEYDLSGLNRRADLPPPRQTRRGVCNSGGTPASNSSGGRSTTPITGNSTPPPPGTGTFSPSPITAAA